MRVVGDTSGAESPRHRWGALRHEGGRHRQRDRTRRGEAIADADRLGPDGVVVDNEADPVDASEPGYSA